MVDDGKGSIRSLSGMSTRNQALVTLARRYGTELFTFCNQREAQSDDNPHSGSHGYR